MKRVGITYCHPCGYRPHAVKVVQLLLKNCADLNHELAIALEPVNQGVFEIHVGDQLAFSKHQAHHFPNKTEIHNLVNRHLR